ncbi:MAG: hypothetical protein ACYC6W_11035 [Nitrosotalea sp.]
MSTPFNGNRDVTGAPAYSPPFAIDNFSTTLAANVAQSVTVPSTSSTYIAIFSFVPGAAVWVANNVAATVPGGSFAATKSQLNPASRFVNAGDVLSFITSDTTDQIGVSFYAVSQ